MLPTHEVNLFPSPPSSQAPHFGQSVSIVTYTVSSTVFAHLHKPHTHTLVTLSPATFDRNCFSLACVILSPPGQQQFHKSVQSVPFACLCCYRISWLLVQIRPHFDYKISSISVLCVCTSLLHFVGSIRCDQLVLKSHERHVEQKLCRRVDVIQRNRLCFCPLLLCGLRLCIGSWLQTGKVIVCLSFSVFCVNCSIFITNREEKEEKKEQKRSSMAYQTISIT